MTLNASQIINNLKKSLNVHIATVLAGETVNYDEDPFDSSELTSWYAVRYTGYESEPVGIGDLIDDTTDKKGRRHVLKAELSAWSRDDEQRVELGAMVDLIITIAEAGSVTLYDFADPENPVSIGNIRIEPGNGTFSPIWGGASGKVLKSSGEMHAEHRLKGYVQEITLTTIAEV